jgi:hypothetical protein
MPGAALGGAVAAARWFAAVLGRLRSGPELGAEFSNPMNSRNVHRLSMGKKKTEVFVLCSNTDH